MRALLIYINIFLILISLLGAYAFSRRRHDRRAVMTSISLALVSVVFCLTLFYQLGYFIPKDKVSLRKKELKFKHSLGYVFGRKISDKYKNAAVLIITSPDYQKRENQKAVFDGLLKGLGKNLRTLEIDSVTLNDIFSYPEEFWNIYHSTSAKDFDAIIKRHPSCYIVISLVGLPTDVEEMQIWNYDLRDRPKVAVINGDIPRLLKAIKNGWIVAATEYKVGVSDIKSNAPSDPFEAFDRRYRLLTPYNVEELKHKELEALRKSEEQRKKEQAEKERKEEERKRQEEETRLELQLKEMKELLNGTGSAEAENPEKKEAQKGEKKDEKNKK